MLRLKIMLRFGGPNNSAIPKPDKPPNNASSYRPINLIIRSLKKKKYSLKRSISVIIIY